MTDTEPGGRRLAIIGCGAAARLCHLPALAAGTPFRLVALVDRIESNARDAAARYAELCAAQGTALGEAPVVSGDLAAVVPGIDAAVVATAHDSHATVAMTLLRAGKHVLIEKPLALTVEQAERIRAASGESGALTMPAHVRRLFPSARWVKSIIDSGRLGTVHRVSWAEGRPYSWPLVSPFMFGPVNAGGGVLADSGPHVLDMLLWWLGEPARVTSVADNADGGADSEVSIGLTFGTVEAQVELSRLRELGNTCAIAAEHGMITVDTGFPAEYTERDAVGTVIASGPVPVLQPAQDTWVGLFREQLADFDGAIAGEPTRLANFDDGVATVRLLKACRALPASRLPQPWTGPHPTTATVDVRVAVTGATGFIGSHIVERLLAAGGRPVAIGRDLTKFARLSHLDPGRLQYVLAETRDRRALVEAVRGSDVIVHTVYGSGGSPEERWSVTVDGTAAVLDAAVEAGVSRIVYLSTVAVYAPSERTSIDEDCPTLAPAGDDLSYGRQKLVAEQQIMAASGRVEVVCLQPTVVYGPAAPSWTVQPLRRLRVANHVLPTGPDTGVCNAVHVQDVADAAVFATTADGLDQTRLLVSGPNVVSWGQYYDAYRSMLCLQPPQRHDPDALEAWERGLYASRSMVDTSRLRAVGFEPRVPFADGIGHVAAWARWAGLTLRSSIVRVTGGA
jgi:predicted dehydrogenase/nucleoside-diphosphate-sugar epimerase